MIIVEQVSKVFAASVGVRDLSFHVGRGERVGFLGPNGAGKTTLMRLLATYWAPTRGRILIDGRDVFEQSFEVRRRLGYLPQTAPLYPEMRVDEYLSFRAKIKGVPRRRRRDRLEEVKADFQLKEVERRLIGHLSQGTVRRVALADSLLHTPEVLLLDEPTAGLDPVQARAALDLIAGLSPRVTVVLATHIPAEGEAVCSRLFLLDRGRCVSEVAPASRAAARAGAGSVTAELAGPAAAIVPALQALDDALSVRPDSRPAPPGDGAAWRRYSIKCRPGADVREAVAALAAARGWPLRDLRCAPEGAADWSAVHE